jgi:hypothetical protein
VSQATEMETGSVSPQLTGHRLSKKVGVVGGGGRLVVSGRERVELRARARGSCSALPTCAGGPKMIALPCREVVRRL